MLEQNLGRLEGVKAAKMGKNKFHYDLKIAEGKTLLPSHIQDMVKKLQDYSYRGFEITAISGKAEKKGDGYVFSARGSKQQYALKASDDLKKLVAAGKADVTLAGEVTEPDATEAEKKNGKKPLPVLEVTEAKQASK